MKALDRKLLRDTFAIRAQVVSIALVIAAGIAGFLALGGNWYALESARDRYYRDFRFGDVFATLERAPLRVADELALVPGVRGVAARIVEHGTLSLPDLELPVRARLVSLENRGGPPGEAPVDAVDLRRGRWPESEAEAILLEAFAEKHQLGPGSRIEVVLHGTRHAMTVTGLGASPSEVFPMPMGEVAPDPERFAVLWMRRTDLEGAAGMSRAFNDVALRVDPSMLEDRDAASRAVMAAVDRILAPYGGTGAMPRSRHPSNAVLEGELSQLRTISLSVPALFFGVATLLVQVVLTRLVQLQRASIATLKAIGYTDRRIALHYLELAAFIGILGATVGLLLGVWLGRELTALYARFFRFPNFGFSVRWGEALGTIAASIASAIGGSLGAVRAIVRLPPAVAMHATPPAAHRTSWLDRPVVRRWLVPSASMLLRDARRRPMRTLLGVLAMAASVGLLVVARWFGDATDALIEIQFHRAMGEDIALSFDRAVDARDLGALLEFPGVWRVDPVRMVPGRIRAGHLERDVIVSSTPSPGLRRLVDRRGLGFAVAPSGLMLSDALADAIDVTPGDTVSLEWRVGAHEHRFVRVAGVVADPIGLQAYASPDYLAELRNEYPLANQALLQVDPASEGRLYERLRDLPSLSGATRRRDLERRFREQTGEMMSTFTLVVTLFATTMALAVVHNQARVSLSMRERELATMRVLGFTRREAATVLVGELASQVLASLPLGLWFGKRMAFALASTVDPERFRMPLALTTQTAAFAVTLTVAAAALTAWSSIRRIARLDLLGVLKAGE